MSVANHFGERYDHSRKVTMGNRKFHRCIFRWVIHKFPRAGCVVAKVQVVAHRGASKAERENTLAAFRRAREMGADMVELDVRRTADMHMAVHHDARLPDGRLVMETTAADMPDHVPFLSDALDACVGMQVNIEIKNHPEDPDFDETDRLAAAVAAHLAERGDDARWLISGFHRPTVDAMRTLRPEVRTAWLTIGVRPQDVAATARSLAMAGHSAINPWTDLLTKDCVDRMHESGLQVYCWTVDDPARMRELIDWGVDGIITNVPDLCRDMVGA